ALAGTNVSPISTFATTGGTTATFATAADGGTAVAAPSMTFTPGAFPNLGVSPTPIGLFLYLNAIPALANNVTVVGVPGGPLSVVYRNGLGAIDVSDTALTVPTAGGTTASVVKDADGGNAPAGTLNGEVQLITFGGTITGGAFTPDFHGYGTRHLPRNPAPPPLAANIQNALPALTSLGAGNVTVTALSATDYRVNFQGLLNQRDVAQIALGTNGLTGTGPTIVTSTLFTGLPGESIGALTLAMG